MHTNNGMHTSTAMLTGNAMHASTAMHTGNAMHTSNAMYTENAMQTSTAIVMGRVVGAGLDGEAQLWRSATWGQGTACTFSQEALGGLARVLGMSGVQLTVLSLSHVDLGEAGMHLLCQGISRCSAVTCTGYCHGHHHGVGVAYLPHMAVVAWFRCKGWMYQHGLDPTCIYGKCRASWLPTGPIPIPSL